MFLHQGAEFAAQGSQSGWTHFLIVFLVYVIRYSLVGYIWEIIVYLVVNPKLSAYSHSVIF